MITAADDPHTALKVRTSPDAVWGTVDSLGACSALSVSDSGKGGTAQAEGC
mgnify:CR=1 FL=1